MSFKSKFLFQRSEDLQKKEDPSQESATVSEESDGSPDPLVEVPEEIAREEGDRQIEEALTAENDEGSPAEVPGQKGPPIEIEDPASVDEILKGFREMKASLSSQESATEEEVKSRTGIDQYLKEFQARPTQTGHPGGPCVPSGEVEDPLDDIFEDFFGLESESKLLGSTQTEKAESSRSVDLSEELEEAEGSDQGDGRDIGSQIDCDPSMVSDILLQEERALEESPPHLGALYLSGVAFVLGSIRAVREDRKPSLDKGRELVREFAISLQEDPALLLAATWREQDFSISTHSANVAILAIRTAQTMGAAEDLQLRVGLASLLHEVGTVRLPDRLTQSEDKLSSDDLRRMRRRPVFSSELLEKIDPAFDWLSEIVGQVYEREDGSGYPLGLKGDEIREEAKLVGVVDFFDACIHKRPYRKPLSGYRALFELTTQHSSAFPERIVKNLIKTLSLYPFNEYVVLSTGEIGKVIEIDRANLSRPKVEILYDRNGTPSTGYQVDLAEESECYISKAITMEELPQE